MLVDCLKGNVGIDLGVEMEIPSEYKGAVFTRMAEVHYVTVFSHSEQAILI